MPLKKLLTPLSALVYFCFLHSFTQSSFSQVDYVKEVWSQELNEIIDPICDVSYEKWAGICTYYIKKIRGDYNIYEEMRVSYTAFFSVSLDEKCQKKNLRLFDQLPNNSFYAEQYMMNCFCREAIVPANKSFQEYKFYREIAIYPKDENTMMVFQYSKQHYDFILFEKYDEVYWSAIPEIGNPLVFKKPPPHVINDEEAIYNELVEKTEFLEQASSNISNIVFAADEAVYQRIKIMLFKYSSEANEETLVFPEKRRHRLLRDNKILKRIPACIRLHRNSLIVRQFFLNAYTCTVCNKETQKIKHSLKLSAGPEIHSVLFLKKTSCNNQTSYRITDLFENLYLNLISYYL